MKKPRLAVGIVEYTPPKRFDEIPDSAKGVPTMPGQADLDRGFVPLSCGDEQSKTAFAREMNSMDDNEVAGGFVRRGNKDERL